MKKLFKDFEGFIKTKLFQKIFRFYSYAQFAPGEFFDFTLS